MSRPATVTAAAWITIIMSAISGLLWLLLGLAMVFAGNDITERIQDDPTLMRDIDEMGISASQLEDGVVGFGIASIVIGLIMLAMILAGMRLLKGSNAARIIVVIAAVITLLFGLLLIGTIISGLWVLAAIAVIVLLFVGDANKFFSKSH